MTFIIAVALVGLIPALIASKKGYTTIVWWLYGALLFPIALIHSLLMSPINIKKCPQCAEQIQKAALVCKHCGHKLSETPTAETDNGEYRES